MRVRMVSLNLRDKKSQSRTRLAVKEYCEDPDGLATHSGELFAAAAAGNVAARPVVVPVPAEAAL
jgi:hypothetical protein